MSVSSGSVMGTPTASSASPDSPPPGSSAPSAVRFTAQPTSGKAAIETSVTSAAIEASGVGRRLLAGIMAEV
ncbi:MAG: hypothetical protein IPF92_17095 [Myxococcales bacterium]|nr:hypothetical protein [Myxococcales bacterium]